jgi:hypothetical protein
MFNPVSFDLSFFPSFSTQDDEVDDGIDDAEQQEVEFIRQAEAILHASDWHGHFRITHAAQLQ